MERRDKNKVLLIGLDGATWCLLKPWAEEGKLPVLNRLMETGSWGVLESTIPCRTCPALPALYTGKNTGKLGFSDFLNPDGSIMSYNDIREPTIWDILGRQGYKSAVINLRTTYPPRKMDGIMISGRVPSEESRYTYPAEIKEEVKGFHSSSREYRKSKKNFINNAFDFAISDMWRKYRLSRRFILGDFDLAIFWIGATDFAQHYLWHQPSKLLLLYKEVEKILDDVSKNFSGTLIIVSDHGFSRAPITSFHMNTWLKNEGYLKLKGNGVQQWMIGIISPLLLGLPDRFRNVLGNIYRASIRKRRRKANVNDINKETRTPGVRTPFATFIDFNNSAAFTDRYWGIWVSKDNNPRRDYEKTRHEIIKKLEDLKDSKGNKVIKYVKRREEIFDGRYLNRIPDIVFMTYEDIVATHVLSNSLFRKRKGTFLTGTHDMSRDGIVIATGPDIKEGTKLKETDITDITPTILHILNTAVPRDIDGKVIKELFREKSETAKRPVEYEGLKRIEEEKIKGSIRKLKVLERI